MKNRVISAACGVALVVTVFMLNNIFSLGLNIVIGIIGAIAIYEIQIATGYVKNKALFILSLVFTQIIIFLPSIISNTASLISAIGVAVFCYLVILFVIMLMRHDSVSLDNISLVFLTTIIITIAFLTTILLRDKMGIFHVIFILTACWSTDIAALFTGMLFGKHKLAPNISPKKTIEGAIGGFIVSAAVIAGLCWLYAACGGFRGASIQANYIPIMFAGMLCSIISVFGDLSFSIIKRHCNIKDFGNIMPGHGGVLDRFDSVIFVSPFFFLFVQYFPIMS